MFDLIVSVGLVWLGLHLKSPAHLRTGRVEGELVGWLGLHPPALFCFYCSEFPELSGSLDSAGIFLKVDVASVTKLNQKTTVLMVAASKDSRENFVFCGETLLG
jgi:hypothetical protein